jgi:hypothetical protein
VRHRYPVKKSNGQAAAKRPDGMPVGVPFKPGQSGNPEGRAKGVPNLSTRIRNILEGDEPLPDVIAATIEKVIGGSKKPLDAVIIAGLLQALQGDKGWAEWLSNNGYGKPKERVEHTGDEGGPIKMIIAWEGD